MKLHDYFEHLLDVTVNLNQSRIDSLDARVAVITTFVKAHPELGPLVLDVIAHGSYAQRTIIKPRVGRDFDIDVLLDLVEQPDWEPCQYIAKLYSAFRSTPTYKPMVDRKTRCVTVDYANDFHIDVVPYVGRAGTHYITNRKDNRFELTNPTGFNEWLDTQNRAADGHLVHVIRLMKFLRDLKGNFGVKSVILTTLLGGRVNDALALADPKYYCDLPTALYHNVRDLD
nr:nucleotidyltransferase [Solirubrobacterales bacterium]